MLQGYLHPRYNADCSKLQQFYLLGLLDLSAAFDCVDHDILVRRLQLSYGIGGSALAWVVSFLTGRTQQVCYNGYLSAISSLIFGVPQGSSIGPLLYLLYSAEVFDVIADCGLIGHSYADDTQTYISVPATDAPVAMQRLAVCIERIEQWMGRNRLKLNQDKTQIIWIGTRQQLAKVSAIELTLPSAVVRFSTIVSDLGFIVDSQLNMSDHVAQVCRSCYFQLRQLRHVRRSLTPDAVKTLIHAFISSRLDYCNSLLTGVSDGVLRKLQSVQNAAARLITNTRKFDHITPVLRDLHWLPVRQRIEFKTAMLVYKCLHGLAPSYLSEFCRPVSSLPGRRQLRSGSTGILHVPRTKTSIGSRSFAVAGPVTWNSLPAELRTFELSVASFAKRLKTYLFNSY